MIWVTQAYHNVERKWKHDRFTVSFEIFKECLVKFQSAAMSAKLLILLLDTAIDLGFYYPR